MKQGDDRMVHVRFPITPDEDGWPDFEWERLWAEPVDEGFVMQNIPFYVHDLGLHDVVAASPTDLEGNYLFEHVIRHSGHRTIRLVVSDPNDVPTVCCDLERLGCSFEKEHGGRFLAVDIPPHVDGTSVKAFLDAEEVGANRFGFDEAHVDWYGPESFGRIGVGS